MATAAEPHLIQIEDQLSAATINATPIPIFAWDMSGSTANMPYYHTMGSKYLSKFITQFPSSSSNPAPIFLTWEYYANQVTLDRLKKIIADKYGNGGTTASCIIKWIHGQFGCTTPIDLWLVTDGELDQTDLLSCSKLNQSMNYASLNFIIISQSQRINMSVGAAFFSGSNVKIFMNDNILKEINTSKPFDYDKVTASNFDETVTELSDYIQAKFMGTEIQGLEEADKLNKLRLRLFTEIDKQEQKRTKAKDQDVDWKNKDDMMQWLRKTKYYKTLKDSDVKDFRTKVDSAISTLVNYIHNTNKSCMFFDILKMGFKQDKVGFAEAIQPDLDLELLEDLPEKCSFFDAVTLEIEQSTPVLLLQITDLINKYWVNGNYNKFRRVAECPLFGQFEDCVGHVFALDTVKQLFHTGSSQFRNPMTNKPSYGGLIPHPAFDQWNDYLIMVTFFRSKNIRTCPALFYYQIWKYATTCEWIDPGVVSLLEQYALRRISSAKTRLAFGSMPMDPTEVVPLPLTIFYCGEGSSLLFAQDPQLYLNERLRQFYPIAQNFVDIMEKLEVPCDPYFITDRAAAFRVLSILKTAGNSMDQKYALISKCFRKLGKFITHEVDDNPSFPVKFLALLNYSHKSIIPFILPPVNVYDHVHISYDSVNFPKVIILKETMRPRFCLQEEGSNEVIPNYKQILASVTEVALEPSTGKIVLGSNVNNPTKLDQTKLLSLSKLYINFTVGNKRYPTLEEYEEFVWKEMHFSGNSIRLFTPQVKELIQTMFDAYQEIVTTVSLEEFIFKGTTGVSILARLELEGVKNDNLKTVKFVERCRKEWLV